MEFHLIENFSFFQCLFFVDMPKTYTCSLLVQRSKQELNFLKTNGFEFVINCLVQENFLYPWITVASKLHRQGS